MPEKRRFNDLPVAQQAGMLCNENAFRQFVGARTIKSGVTVSSSAAAEYLRNFCEISSRRELNTNQPAQSKFQTLRTEYDAWRGRIADQR